MVSPKSHCVLAAIAVAWTTAAFAQQDVVELVKKLPDNVNAVVLVNVKDVLESPLGIAENWTKRMEDNWGAGRFYLPPTATTVVYGSQINDRDFTSFHEAGLVRFNHEVFVNVLAKKERSIVEQIAGKESVLSPRDAYFTTTDKNTMAFMFPADRRSFSQWIRSWSGQERVRISSYLQDAAEVAFKEAPIVMAIDTYESIQPRNVERRLKESTALQGKDADIRAMAKTIASIQGITCAIRIGKEIEGMVRISFGESTDPIKDYAKPLFQEALANWGMEIPDLADWNANVSAVEISFSGTLKTPSLAKLLMTVMELPTGATGKQEPTDQNKQEGGEEGSYAAASQKYYKSVISILDELREFHGKTQGETALWHERTARRIDRLPIFNVDNDLLAFGTQISNTLRSIAESMRGAGLQVGVIQAGTSVYRGGYNNYGWGYWDGAADRQAKQSARAGATQVKISMWNQIDQAAAEIRQKMTQKYNMPF